MVFGDRGTGKSTAARALAGLLPEITVVEDCRYGCTPEQAGTCPDPCHAKRGRKREINLLEDHLVDLLLDVAASGENVVEREGLSARHRARFVLIGSGNPEEGELRPQLLDRFGLSVEVRTPEAIPDRVEIMSERCQAQAERARSAI